MKVELTAEQVCAVWSLVNRASEDYEGRGLNHVPKVDLMDSIKAALIKAMA